MNGDHPPCQRTSWLLAALAAAAVLSVLLLEAYWYGAERAKEETRLAYRAHSYAATLDERLRIHFERLRLIGEWVILPHWLNGEFPPADATLDRLVHEIIASNPSLTAFTVHDATGTQLLWTSVTPPPPPPLFAPSDFRVADPASAPHWLLTLPRLGPAFGNQQVIGVRYPVRDRTGAVAFFVGSPLPTQPLFAPPAGIDPSDQLLVLDRRFDQPVALITANEVLVRDNSAPLPTAFPPETLPAKVCRGPYCVTAALAHPWRTTYFTNPALLSRWIGEGILLAAFLVALWRLQVALTRLVAQQNALAQAFAQQNALAHTDSLTHLPNRLALQEQVPRLLAAASRHGAWVAVGILDLDDFKPVNDQFGHAVGDALLRQLADELRQAVRASDLVARLGGDEFVVILDHLDPGDARAQVNAFGQRLEERLREPLEVAPGVQVPLAWRIGWALYPEHGSDFDALLRRADAVLLALKATKGQHDTIIMAIANEEAHADNPPAALPQLDPFGAAASQLLAAYEGLLLAAAEAFPPTLFAACRTRPLLARLLEALLPNEVAAYQEMVRNHLKELVAAATTPERLAESAARLGRRHALSGLPASEISWAYGQWDQFLQHHLIAAGQRSDTIFRLLYLLRDRATFAEQQQLVAFEAIEERYLHFLLARLPLAARTEREWEEALTAALTELPAILFAALVEPGLDRAFILITASGDPEAVRLLPQAVFTPEKSPRVDRNDPRSQGLVAQAWLRHELTVANDYLHDPRTTLWHDPARAVGMHSMAALPLTTRRGTTQVLILGGRTPYLFSAPFVQHFLLALQHEANARRPTEVLPATATAGPPIPGEQGVAIRASVATGAIAIAVQPVVDLRTGALIKVEALARLPLAGQLLPPGDFFAALRTDEFHSLFRHVLEEGLAWLTRWHTHWPHLQLTINLDPATLAHPELTRWVKEALAAHSVMPERLTLELLETGSAGEKIHREALAALRYLGVRLAFDDVGSGYSGLQRLAELPFDLLKIDQSLVRQLPNHPLPFLAVLRSLARLAEGLERGCVAEGLETFALAEAVSVLGVTLGQGYGIARPMPPEELPLWAERWQSAPWRCYPAAPLATPLGALAYQWQINHERGFSNLAPLEHCPLTDYLATHYPTATEVHAWHEALHRSAAAGDIAGWQQAKDALTDWLLTEAHLSGKMALSRHEPVG